MLVVANWSRATSTFVAATIPIPGEAIRRA